MRSSGPWGNVSRPDSMFERMLCCVSCTPLGAPSLPLEKMIVARSSGVRLRGEPATRSMSHTGATSARMSAMIRSTPETCSRMSSR